MSFLLNLLDEKPFVVRSYQPGDRVRVVRGFREDHRSANYDAGWSGAMNPSVGDGRVYTVLEANAHWTGVVLNTSALWPHDSWPTHHSREHNYIYPPEALELVP